MAEFNIFQDSIMEAQRRLKEKLELWKNKNPVNLEASAASNRELRNYQNVPEIVNLETAKENEDPTLMENRQKCQEARDAQGITPNSNTSKNRNEDCRVIDFIHISDSDTDQSCSSPIPTKELQGNAVNFQASNTHQSQISNLRRSRKNQGYGLNLRSNSENSAGSSTYIPARDTEVARNPFNSESFNIYHSPRSHATISRKVQDSGFNLRSNSITFKSSSTYVQTRETEVTVHLETFSNDPGSGFNLRGNPGNSERSSTCVRTRDTEVTTNPGNLEGFIIEDQSPTLNAIPSRRDQQSRLNLRGNSGNSESSSTYVSIRNTEIIGNPSEMLPLNINQYQTSINDQESGFNLQSNSGNSERFSTYLQARDTEVNPGNLEGFNIDRSPTSNVIPSRGDQQSGLNLRGNPDNSESSSSYVSIRSTEFIGNPSATQAPNIYQSQASRDQEPGFNLRSNPGNSERSSTYVSARNAEVIGNPAEILAPNINQSQAFGKDQGSGFNLRSNPGNSERSSTYVSARNAEVIGNPTEMLATNINQSQAFGKDQESGFNLRINSGNSERSSTYIPPRDAEITENPGNLEGFNIDRSNVIPSRGDQQSNFILRENPANSASSSLYVSARNKEIIGNPSATQAPNIYQSQASRDQEPGFNLRSNSSNSERSSTYIPARDAEITENPGNLEGFNIDRSNVIPPRRNQQSNFILRDNPGNSASSSVYVSARNKEIIGNPSAAQAPNIYQSQASRDQEPGFNLRSNSSNSERSSTFIPARDTEITEQSQISKATTSRRDQQSRFNCENFSTYVPGRNTENPVNIQAHNQSQASNKDQENRCIPRTYYDSSERTYVDDQSQESSNPQEYSFSPQNNSMNSNRSATYISSGSSDSHSDTEYEDFDEPVGLFAGGEFEGDTNSIELERDEEQEATVPSSSLQANMQQKNLNSTIPDSNLETPNELPSHNGQVATGQKKEFFRRLLKRLNTTEEYDDYIASWRPNLECLVCHATQSTFSLLQQHFQQQHPSEKCHIQCCQLNLYTRHEIEKHIHYHKEPFKYKCEICFKCYTSKPCLQMHLLTHTRKAEKPVKCPRCQREFGKQSSLEKHMEKTCKLTNTSLSCEYCGCRFKNKLSLRAHKCYRHNKKQFVCKTCDKVFTTPHSFRDHMNTHTGNFSYDCHFCSRKFQVKRALYAHLTKLHPEEWDREKKEQATQRHLKKVYKCSNCENVYQTIFAWQEHQAVHEGKLKYSCNLCSKVYKYSSNLAAHRKRVHPEEHKKNVERMQGRTSK
ncbi:uncharacterized protein LOC142229548 [Haematobia irritans]|uniref:uncharacterized protein LOC142229548 n=1 Tax=Haematobia irritans TaxID=7368 RepID=UPI003F4FBEB9